MGVMHLMIPFTIEEVLSGNHLEPQLGLIVAAQVSLLSNLYSNVLLPQPQPRRLFIHINVNRLPTLSTPIVPALLPHHSIVAKAEIIFIPTAAVILKIYSRGQAQGALVQYLAVNKLEIVTSLPENRSMLHA